MSENKTAHPVHEQVREMMAQFKVRFETATGKSLALPPPVLTELGTEYTAMDLGKSLKARFPFDLRYSNPAGFYQGGMFAAAFDNVYGPLSFMVTEKPTVTIEMSCTYHRPFTTKDGFMDIEAHVVAHGRNVVVLRAEARNPGGKLLATSTTHLMVMPGMG